MNQKKLLTVYIIATLLIVGGGIYFLSATATNNYDVGVSQKAKVEVDKKNYDWGNIPYNGGNAIYTFNIKSSGSETLKLTNIKTSCACTKAQVIIDGNISPFFDMHSTSSWVGEVKPGREAQLKVIFDPTFHGPSAIGPIERLVSVETSDAANQKLEFSLKGVVVK